MKALLDYFIKKPAAVNVILFGVLFSSLFTWQQIGKEEMPELAFNFLRVAVRYPGASAQDVEVFVTKPIEEQLKGVTGLEEVQTTSAYANATLSVVFEAGTKNLSEKVQEVKDAVDAVDLPREIDEPTYHQFKTSEKAISDIGIFLKDREILDTEARSLLQSYALGFKDRLLSFKEISGMEASGYLRPELHINVNPQALKNYEIPLSQVREQIIAQHVRAPIGSLHDQKESEVALVAELATVDALDKVIVRSGFQGQSIALSEIAKVEHGFERPNSIFKVQGREGVIYNIKKSISADILSAQKVVTQFIDSFRKANPDSPVDFVFMDDESYDVRNRLSLIATNGLLGFALIILVLFFFLDFRSGVWVAMGIPFSLALTLIVALSIGYTVNNMTLAAIIIVLGIVVDDAIIVAENITRRRERGNGDAAYATSEVLAPIIASVLTTCVAFLPLLLFQGRFGMFVKYIPVVVFAMLGASLIESFFLLPSHMSSDLPFQKTWGRWRLSLKFSSLRSSFIRRLENIYAKVLVVALNFRSVLLLFFAVLLIAAGYVYKTQMKYVMFPREESKDFRLQVVASEGTSRVEMAKMVGKIERYLLNDKHKVVTNLRSSIGHNRRGGEVRDNEASLRVEILPPSERSISLDALFEVWQKEFDSYTEFTEVRFQKSWFGSDSGSPIHILVSENNDKLRTQAVERLEQELKNIEALNNVEIERPITKPEYLLEIKKSEVSRLGINFQDLATNLRAYIEGEILYTLNTGNEEVDVRMTTSNQRKDEIEKILSLTVSNNEGYQVPLSGLVDLVKRRKPANIQRTNFKRATAVYADINKEVGKTPLELAEFIEEAVFPKIESLAPSIALKFRGEVEESRESQGDFVMALILSVLLIYVILVFVFNSMWTPFLIAFILPFGAVGVIFAFWLHGMTQYGFFAAVGTIGMLGVVINDSIVLIDRLKARMKVKAYPRAEFMQRLSLICSTRLRAVIVTTLTTVAGLFPTAYGLGGYDSMLAEMMLAMGWGLVFGMLVTLFLVPCIFSYYIQMRTFLQKRKEAH